MKKIFLTVLASVFMLTPMIGWAETASAGAPLAANTAFRTESNSTVYWYANGVRYPFPNAETYFTWFASFDNVRVVHDSYLEVYPLGDQNITYRPGAKLVKSTTGEKVYAVARYGVLRHIVSPSVATSLYGANWSTKVQDIPDAFFSNYTIGTPIYSASDYNASNEYNSVVYPHESLRNVNANTNNYYGTGELSFTANRTSIISGQEVSLAASYGGTLPYNGRIEIKNTRNSATVKTCYTTYCALSVYPQQDTEGNHVQYIATVKNSDGSYVTSRYSPVIYIGNGVNGDAVLSLTNRIVSDNYETITFAASVSRAGYTNANTTLRIYDAPSGELITTCYGQTYCIYTRSFSAYQERSWYVRATNSNGDSIQSGMLNFSTNGGANNTQDWTLNFITNKSVINSGEAVTFTATTNSTRSDGFWIDLYDERTGERIGYCRSNSCTITKNVYRSGSETSALFSAVLRPGPNGLGYQLAERYLTLTFDQYANTGTNNNGTYAAVQDLRIDMSDTLIYSGDLVKLTVNAYNVGNWNYAGNRIDILDTRTGNVVRTCYDQSWCVADVRVYRNGNEGTVRYEARFYDSGGNYAMNEIGTPIYFISY